MASEQRLPEAGLGPALAARVTPRQRSGRRSVLGRTPGSLATRAIRFGQLVGLSTLNRQSAVEVERTTAMNVRPPIEYWPWDDTTATGRVERAAAASTGAPFVPTGDARLDAIRKARLAKQATGTTSAGPAAVARRAVAAARPVRRGLPRTTSRQGRTAAGIGTAPGAIAHRIQPESAAERSQPAGPFATRSSAPTPLAPVATTGGRSALLASTGNGPSMTPAGAPSSVAAARQWPGDRPGALPAPVAARSAAPAVPVVPRTPASLSPAAPTSPGRPKRAAEATNVSEFLDATPAGDGWDKVRAVRRLIEARKQQEQAAMWPGDEPGTPTAAPSPTPSPFSSPAPTPRRPAAAPPIGDGGSPRLASPDPVQRRLATEQPPTRPQPSADRTPRSALGTDPAPAPARTTTGLGTALAERPSVLDPGPAAEHEPRPAPVEPVVAPLPTTVAPPPGVPTVQRTMPVERATVGTTIEPTAVPRTVGLERPAPVAPLPAAARALARTTERLPAVPVVTAPAPAAAASMLQRATATALDAVSRTGTPDTPGTAPTAPPSIATETDTDVARRAPIRRGVVAPSPLPMAAMQRTPVPSAAMVALLSAADGTMPGRADRYGAGVLQRRADGGGIVWQQTAAPVQRSATPPATPVRTAPQPAPLIPTPAPLISAPSPLISARRAGMVDPVVADTASIRAAAPGPGAPGPTVANADRSPSISPRPTPPAIASPNPAVTGWAPPANRPQPAPPATPSVSRADAIRRALADARDPHDAPTSIDPGRPAERLPMQWAPEVPAPAAATPAPALATPAPPSMPFIAAFPAASAPGPAAIVAANQAAMAPHPTIARTAPVGASAAPALRITTAPGPRHLVRPATPGSLFRAPVVAPVARRSALGAAAGTGTPTDGATAFGPLGRSTPGVLSRTFTDEAPSVRNAEARAVTTTPPRGVEWAVAPAAVRVETVTTAPTTPVASPATPAPAKKAKRGKKSATTATLAPSVPPPAVPARITADLLGGTRRSLVAPGPGTLRRALAANDAATLADAAVLRHDGLGNRDTGDAERSAAGQRPVAGVPFLSRTLADPRPTMAAPGPAPAPPAPTTVAARRPVDLGETFLTELSKHRQERPRPLPVQFRPIAEIVAPNVTAKISTSKASQEALRAVGKVAATTGDVIHLARTPLAPTGRGAEVLAHELTHVAHASAAPRFFDDHRPSKEEQTAEEVGRIMRRSPLLPRASAASSAAPLVDRGSMAPPPVSAPAGSGPRVPSSARGNVVRRSATSRGSRPAAPKASGTTPGFTSAAALAAHYLGEAPPPAPAAPRSSSSSVIRRAETETPTRSATKPVMGSHRAPKPLGETEAFEDPTRFPAASSTQLLDQFDHILELLQERIITEIERRGRRYRGGF